MAEWQPFAVRGAPRGQDPCGPEDMFDKAFRRNLREASAAEVGLADRTAFGLLALAVILYIRSRNRLWVAETMKPLPRDVNFSRILQ